ncbi:MAG: hypothetical protein JXA87_03820 [Thermoleophilia bacterium]|nr:hypothetical protein [Thermoleophilia bacterium]
MQSGNGDRIYGVGARPKPNVSVGREVQEEARARQARNAQPASSATFQYRVLADFGQAEDGKITTDWIDFAHIQFTKEPSFLSGSKRIPQPGESALAEDASNFDPMEHFAVPGDAMVLAYRTNSQGHYTGAKLLLFASASVPDDYRVVIYGLFVGPAVRGA